MQVSMESVPLNDLRRHNASLCLKLGRAAENVLQSGWYVLGENVAAFEREFAAYCGVAHCVGSGNGTDALELGLRALGIGPGMRVVTVANAGMYSTTAIRAVGAEPLFVDVESRSSCMDARMLASLLEQKPAALIATHLYGQLANMGEILDLCTHAQVPVIEDCAQAHGAVRDGRKAGSFGALACFSFYPTKNLGALGDGGAIVTSDDALAEKLRRLQQYGWGSKYVAVIEGGRNSRLDEIQAAFLRVKLPLLDSWNARRRDIANRYVDSIDNPGLQLPTRHGEDNVAHLFVLRARDRNAFREYLCGEKVVNDVHYPVPDHRQPCFVDRYAQLELPETELACEEILTLPCFPEMTDQEVQRVIDVCNAWRS